MANWAYPDVMFQLSGKQPPRLITNAKCKVDSNTIICNIDKLILRENVRIYFGLLDKCYYLCVV